MCFGLENQSVCMCVFLHAHVCVCVCALQIFQCSRITQPAAVFPLREKCKCSTLMYANGYFFFFFSFRTVSAGFCDASLGGVGGEVQACAGF